MITNLGLAGLLAVEATRATGHLQRAFKKASRSAFLWPVEASELVEQGRSLTELAGIGPFLEKAITRWFEAPMVMPETDELCDDFLTLSEARRILARKPDFAKAYKGDLQMHSTWSDGSGPIQEMAQAAVERGYHYIAVTDHSKGLKIAGGIDEKALEKQAREIEQVNSKLALAGQRFSVLRSVELNLNPRGEGDMDRAALGKLDLVLGSFHSALRVTTDQTERYLAALRNPDIHILGHPRGRVFNYRLGLKADWNRVFAEAARLDKAVEIDSFPDRQDLNVALLKIVKKEGCRVAIDTDAHHAWQLGFVELGLAAALKAKIAPERIINFMATEKLKAWSQHNSGRVTALERSVQLEKNSR